MGVQWDCQIHFVGRTWGSCRECYDAVAMLRGPVGL